ncbi:MAG: hypothetical protein HQL46_00740 [Gammaproteobacteria bacterium]|nr:hypothetical protein [Gammaproteobacteria bacterium]
MKNNLLLSVAVAGAIAIPSISFAGTEAGDKTIGIFLNYSKMEDADDASGYGAITAGYFISDAIEINGQFSTSIGETMNGFVYGGANYHFATRSTTVPYVGTAYGQSVGDGDTDFSIISVLGGLKSFVSENVNINTQLRYDDMSFTGGSTSQVGLNVGVEIQY